MVYLPDEIQNIIYSFVERPQTNKIFKYLIYGCYKEDYDPYYYEYADDMYYYTYSFQQWYFKYRIYHQKFMNGVFNNCSNPDKYYHTPFKLSIGHDKLFLSIGFLKNAKYLKMIC